MVTRQVGNSGGGRGQGEPDRSGPTDLRDPHGVHAPAVRGNGFAERLRLALVGVLVAAPRSIDEGDEYHAALARTHRARRQGEGIEKG